MSAVRLKVPFAVLFIAVAIPPATVAAQPPGAVRVVNEPAPIRRWFRAPLTDVLVTVDPGTTLDVLDEERGWYWVVAPRDAHGTRRVGWIRGDQVETVISRRATARTASVVPGVPPATNAPSLVSVAEDRVTITTRDAPAETRANSSAAASYAFEDVHFDRDRHAIRGEDLNRLQTVVAALKADPALAVNIEGYTCNLGSPAHNLALGVRRANAVRDYLVSQGVAAERLHAVSLGEERPKHDNASEDTRRLNRRVAVVPGPTR
jgi:outer membrane protein OmpA-like peptidoglycan-associated protein